MSDEEPEIPGIMINIGEMMERQREAHERHRMMYDDAQHRVQSFLAELEREDLETVQILMRMFIQAENPELLGAYFDGICSAYLASKHDVCVACGVDHAEELSTLAATDDGETDE